jgi:hypothetical protein
LGSAAASLYTNYKEKRRDWLPLIHLFHELLCAEPTQNLRCTCPRTPCPVFTIRCFWGTPALYRAISPLLTDSNFAVRSATLKTLWRLFHLFHTMPVCLRYDALDVYARGGVSKFDEYARLSCPPQELNPQLFNTLLELLTGDLTLPPLMVLARNNPEPDREIDLFTSDVLNPILLPSIFLFLRSTPLEFRAKVTPHPLPTTPHHTTAQARFDGCWLVLLTTAFLFSFSFVM